MLCCFCVGPAGGIFWRLTLRNWGNIGSLLNKMESTLGPGGSQGNPERVVITNPVLQGLRGGKAL